MSRAPSDATMLRSARKEIRDLERQIAGTIKDREAYRVRATKAEQECAEWKRRFDLLLARVPANEPVALPEGET